MKKEFKQYNKPASQEIPESSQVVGCIIVLVILGICGFYLFSDPLDELTRGCSSDGAKVAYNGEMYERFYCKNKPWCFVQKYKDVDSNHWNYAVNIRDIDNTDEYFAKYFWENGEYRCTIYNSPYVEENNKWYELGTGERFYIYDDNCDKKEFIKRIKDTLNSDEYAWTKLKNISIVKYNKWSEITTEIKQCGVFQIPITSNIKAEDRFENYRKTVQKALERRKNKNSW